MIREKNPKMKTDMVLLILVLLLAVFGLIMLFSISEYNGRVRFGDSAYYFKKQLFATALGLMAMYIVAEMDYRFFRGGWHRLPIFCPWHFPLRFCWWDRRLTVPRGG